MYSTCSGGKRPPPGVRRTERVVGEPQHVLGLDVRRVGSPARRVSSEKHLPRCVEHLPLDGKAVSFDDIKLVLEHGAGQVGVGHYHAEALSEGGVEGGDLHRMQEMVGLPVPDPVANLPIDLPVRRPERLPEIVQGQVHPAIKRIEPTTRVGRLARPGTADQPDHALTT